MTGPYDAQKAHEYYELHKHLKGRHPGTARTLTRTGGTRVRGKRPPSAAERQAAARARSVRLTKKLHSLNAALREATEALRKKRQAAQKSRATAKKTARKNSDGKTTAKERLKSKEYRQKHKAELASKAKKAGSSSKGKSPAAKKSVSSMSESELTHRISTIKSLITDAKRQLRAAHSLSHSITDTENHLTHDGVERPLTLN